MACMRRFLFFMIIIIIILALQGLARFDVQLNTAQYPGCPPNGATRLLTPWIAIGLKLSLDGSNGSSDSPIDQLLIDSAFVYVEQTQQICETSPLARPVSCSWQPRWKILALWEEN